MKQQTISIAMCTYNGAKYLTDQLNSIVNQSRLPNELIVCDDASIDSSVKIVEFFAQKAPFPVRIVVNEEKLGSTKNFEKAISLCTGDIVALADQDDIWLPEKLSKLEQALNQNPDADFVFSDAKMVDEHLNPLGYNLWQSKSVLFLPYYQKLFKRHRSLEVLLVRYIVTGATMAFRARLKNLILPIHQSWVHDAWIAMISAATGAGGIYISKPLILYRQHSAQQIGAKTPRTHCCLSERVAQIVNKCVGLKRLPDSEFMQESCRHEHLEYLIQFLETKLGPSPPSHLIRGSIKLIQKKISHQKARLTIMTLPRFYGLPLSIREIVNINYFRFSTNWLGQCIADLLFR